MSFVHIIVGAKGSGKSTFIKSLLKKVKDHNSLMIYDINDEYYDFYPYPFLDFDEFLFKSTLVSKCVIVFEEATIFLSTRSNSQDLKKLMVRSRHTKNFIFLVFHSIRSIPQYIFELSNFITIFKTIDRPDLTARELKDERIEEIMNNVNDNSNPFYHFTLKIR